MIQLQPELEAQLASEARAKGLSLDGYVEKIVRARPVEDVEVQPTVMDREARIASLEQFFEEMAAHSDEIPILPIEAFSRESIYQDHD